MRPAVGRDGRCFALSSIAAPLNFRAVTAVTDLIKETQAMSLETDTMAFGVLQ
jgi:hypothetical protein